MVQADTGRIRELGHYLVTKSEDADLWLNIIANPHMLPNGVTVGKGVLISSMFHEFDEFEVDIFTKKDCALWFTIFPLLKVVFPTFTVDHLNRLLKMEEKFQNKEKVLK